MGECSWGQLQLNVRDHSLNLDLALDLAQPLPVIAAGLLVVPNVVSAMAASAGDNAAVIVLGLQVEALAD